MKNDVCKKIVFAFAVTIIILPFLMTIPFTTLSADDFSMTIKDYSIKECALRALSLYHSWGGNVPGFFIEYLLNPLHFSNSYSLLPGTELVAFFLAFLLALYFFVRVTIKQFFTESSTIQKIVYIALLIVFLNSDQYQEVLYWYIGGFLLLSKFMVLMTIVSSIWLFKTEKKIKACVITSVCGIIACFNYTFAVTVGLVYLILWYINCKTGSKKTRRKKEYIYVIPLIFMIIAGCIAVFAPGNYYRYEHTSDATGIQLIDIWNATVRAFKNTVKFSRLMLGNPLFVLALLLSFFTGVYYIKKEHKLNPLVLWVSCFVSIFCFLFPIALGYSGRGLPNRHVFNVNLLVICWGMISSLYTGSYFSEKVKVGKYGKYIRWGIVLASVVLIAIQPINIYVDLPWIKTMGQINNVKEESIYNRAILEEIENNTEKNIIIHREQAEMPEKTGLLCDIGMNSNPDYWINRVMSNWYDKETIVFEIEP